MPLPDGHTMTPQRYVDLFREGERHTFEWIESHPELDNVPLERIALDDDDDGYVGNVKLAIKIGGPVLIPCRDGGWLLMVEEEEAEQFNELWPEIRDKWNTRESSQGRPAAEEA